AGPTWIHGPPHASLRALYSVYSLCLSIILLHSRNKAPCTIFCSFIVQTQRDRLLNRYPWSKRCWGLCWSDFPMPRELTQSAIRKICRSLDSLAPAVSIVPCFRAVGL